MKNKKGYLVTIIALIVIIIAVCILIIGFNKAKEESLKIKSFCEENGLIFDPDAYISHYCYKKEDGIWIEYKVMKIDNKFSLIK